VSVLLIALIIVLVSFNHTAAAVPSDQTGTPSSIASSSSRSSALVTAGTWNIASLQMEVDALITDPRTPSRLLAGTASGVWESTDGGQTWTQDSSSPSKQGVMALAATSDGSILFAGATNGIVYAWNQDGGRGWQPISPVLGSGNPIFALAAAPGSTSTLLAGTVGGVFRGARTGSQWHWRQVVRTGDSSAPAITWLPWQPDTAFATEFGSAPAVFRSTDGGQTWRPDTAGLPATLPVEALLPLATPQHTVVLSTMGDGVWLRTPSGEWKDVSGDLPEHHGMPLVASAGDQQVYTGTMGWGIYGTLPSSITDWRRLGNQLTGPGYIVLSLAITRDPQPYLVAGTAVGIYRYALQG
jgi:photosystem II stability/assembly factor-like uncharacterized protein